MIELRFSPLSFTLSSLMDITILIAFGSAIVAAVLGAYLQRLWTPDPRPQITALGTRLTAFQERIETIERERAELENFSLELSLQQAASQHYILSVKNDSDREVKIETINLEYKGLPLSRPSKPKQMDDWKIGKRSEKQLYWAPQPDPVTQLQYSSLTVPVGVAIPITLVTVCTIEGKAKTVKGTQVVTVNFGNRRMTPFGP